jgi:hypothetical protein
MPDQHCKRAATGPAAALPQGQCCSTYLRNVWGPPEIFPGHHFAPREDAASWRESFRDLPEGSQDLVNLANADGAKLATLLLDDCFTVPFF